MREILLSQLDRENNKLNHAGDKLMTIKVDSYDLHNYMVYLDLVFEFDYVADSLSNMYQAVLECFSNKDLLKHCIEFINEISFMVSSFMAKVTEFEESLLWKNS